MEPLRVGVPGGAAGGRAQRNSCGSAATRIRSVYSFVTVSTLGGLNLFRSASAAVEFTSGTYHFVTTPVSK